MNHSHEDVQKCCDTIWECMHVNDFPLAVGLTALLCVFSKALCASGASKEDFITSMEKAKKDFSPLWDK